MRAQNTEHGAEAQGAQRLKHKENGSPPSGYGLGQDLIRYVVVVLHNCTSTYALSMLSLPVPDGKSLRGHPYLRSRTQLPPTFFHVPVHGSVGLESALLFTVRTGGRRRVLCRRQPACSGERSCANPGALPHYQGRAAAALKVVVGKEVDVNATVNKATELFGRLDVTVRVYLFLLLLPRLLYHRPVLRAPSSHSGRACTLECIAR